MRGMHFFQFRINHVWKVVSPLIINMPWVICYFWGVVFFLIFKPSSCLVVSYSYKNFNDRGHWSDKIHPPSSCKTTWFKDDPFRRPAPETRSPLFRRYTSQEDSKLIQMSRFFQYLIHVLSHFLRRTLLRRLWSSLHLTNPISFTWQLWKSRRFFGL